MGIRALCGRWFAMSGLEASMKLKILAIVALGVVGIGAAFVALGGLPASASATTQYLTGAVTTGDVSDDVAATGTMATTGLLRRCRSDRRPISPARPPAQQPTSQTTWTVQASRSRSATPVKKGAGPGDRRRRRPQATARRSPRAPCNSAAIQLAIAKTTGSAATTTAPIRQTRIEREQRRDAGLGRAQDAATTCSTRSGWRRSSPRSTGSSPPSRSSPVSARRRATRSSSTRRRSRSRPMSPRPMSRRSRSASSRR